MSRFWVLIGGVILALLAVAATSLAFGITTQESRAARAAHVEYAAAHASAEQVAVISDPSLVVGRRAGPARIPEALALVFVGSLLIGLAAAVRRTT